ncbi:DUF3188 domain-containing protein [Cyanobium sp. HWJ4-Hawea]|nr:DUF3188 domain-containing protein [Cyanobium sp. HWJ4-Hawea]MCP9808595.1 DUF3188 domain-containing protein [Cyanobium sp. HWJ4-Hawea]
MKQRPLLQGLLALSSPLLIALAVVVLLQRQGVDKLQALPALLIGSGLLISSGVHRRRWRRELLLALRQDEDKQEPHG